MPLGSYSGAVMLQMSGGTYIDEATGTTMTMGAGDLMSAVMPTVASGTAVSGVWLTAMTSMAQARAAGMAGGMTDTNIAAANTAMGNYFSVGDILKTRPMDPTVAGSGTNASQDARNYGMTLAAMSQYAENLNMSVSSAMVTAMMSDAADGVMDGMRGSTPISMSMGGMMGGGNMVTDGRRWRPGRGNDDIHELGGKRLRHDRGRHGRPDPEAGELRRSNLMSSLRSTGQASWQSWL